MVEGAEIIAYDITRYAIFESIYLDFDSKVIEILKGKLCQLVCSNAEVLGESETLFRGKCSIAYTQELCDLEIESGRPHS